MPTFPPTIRFARPCAADTLPCLRAAPMSLTPGAHAAAHLGVDAGERDGKGRVDAHRVRKVKDVGAAVDLAKLHEHVGAVAPRRVVQRRELEVLD